MCDTQKGMSLTLDTRNDIWHKLLNEELADKVSDSTIGKYSALFILVLGVWEFVFKLRYSVCMCVKIAFYFFVCFLL